MDQKPNHRKAEGERGHQSEPNLTVLRGGRDPRREQEGDDGRDPGAHHRVVAFRRQRRCGLLRVSRTSTSAKLLATTAKTVVKATMNSPEVAGTAVSVGPTRIS